MDKVNKALTMLNQGVSELCESENYRKFLTTLAKFHQYSFNNCVLISMQCPEATHVAGYNTWKSKFNRQVRKGEKGITIVAPAPYNSEEPVIKDGKPLFDEAGMLVTESVKRWKFRSATVFDVSQTEGEPLPALVHNLKDPVDGFYTYLQALESVSPVPVRFDDISQNGYFSFNKQEIVIKRGMSESQTIKTLVHECAHALLHGKADGLNRQTREVQAESVAFCCCSAFGIDTSDFSFGYIVGWGNRDLKELKESLTVIRDASSRIIKAAENHFAMRIEAVEALDGPKISL